MLDEEQDRFVYETNIPLHTAQSWFAILVSGAVTQALIALGATGAFVQTFQFREARISWEQDGTARQTTIPPQGQVRAFNARPGGKSGHKGDM